MRSRYPKNYIKEIREAKSLSLEKVAQAVGVTNPYISMLELGKRGLSWNMMRRLSNALQCSPMEIVEGPNNRLEAKGEEEGALLAAYRKLSHPEQKLFLHILQSFVNAAQIDYSSLSSHDGHDMHDGLDAASPQEP